MRHNNTVVKMVKYGRERFSDVPDDWSDKEIDAYLTMWGPITKSIIWCNYDENLFNNPYVVRDYTDNPVPDGHKRIRVAYEEFMHLTVDKVASDEELNKFVVDKIKEKCFNYGFTFIWCWENEELFGR